MTSATDKRPVLITGGAGFIGCNIADRLAAEGHDVIVYDALKRPGVEANLAWLEARHGSRIASMVADVRDAPRLGDAVAQAKAIFHLAAQVAVTTSIVDPRDDLEINVGGTFNLLEAVRLRAPATPVLFASTNKVYGDLADLAFEIDDEAYRPRDPRHRANGIGEDRPLSFHTPYGCSKGAADQYVLDYTRSYGLHAAVMRMSCIYGERQMGTEDQGWVAHFIISALLRWPIAIYGDGYQVRDILDVSDAVDAYLAAWRRIDDVRGRALNLGGGPGNAISLRRLLSYVRDLIGRDLDISFADWRAGDQRYFVADTRAARAALDLDDPLDWRIGVERLVRWLADARGLTDMIPTTQAGAAA